MPVCALLAAARLVAGLAPAPKSAPLRHSIATSNFTSDIIAGVAGARRLLLRFSSAVSCARGVPLEAILHLPPADPCAAFTQPGAGDDRHRLAAFGSG
jgi:hypothetical protein